MTANANPLQVLHVEDSRLEAFMVKKFLETPTPGRYAIINTDTFQKATQALQQHHFDIVLLDLSLPDAHGLDLLRAIEDIVPTVPVVVVTGEEDQELGLQVMRAGAQSCLLKGQFNPQSLDEAIQHAIEQKAAEVAHHNPH
jgi:DNA-binding NarL/FixJ family response regulator